MARNLWVQISTPKTDSQSPMRSMTTKLEDSTLLRMISSVTLRGDKAQERPPSKSCLTANLISLRASAIMMVEFGQLRIGQRISKESALVILVTWGSTLCPTTITIGTLITLAPTMRRACRQTRSSTISGRQTWLCRLLKLMMRLRGLWRLTLKSWRLKMISWWNRK